MYDLYKGDEMSDEISREDIKENYKSLTENAKEIIEEQEKILREKFIDGINRLSEETGYVIDIPKPTIMVRKKI